jgi:hypothetical protein
MNKSLKIGVLIILSLFVIRYLAIERLVYLAGKKPSESAKRGDIEEYKNITKNISNQVKMSDDKIRLKRLSTGHLFGLKILESKNMIDLTKLNKIIEFNPDKKYIQVGGNTNLLELIMFLQKRGYGLKVIPDMDHLTIGGLYAGIGGGARTFKYGAFFNTVIKVEIVTGGGKLLICDKNTNSELFKLLPSTLGTLGYALSLWLEVEEIKKYVFSKTIHHNNFKDYLENIKELMNDPSIDFLDGAIINPQKFVIITGKQTNERGNNKLFGKKLGIPYYIMVEEGYSGIYEYFDFIYRWDVDGYWSFDNDNFWLKFMANKYVRKFLDKRLFGGNRMRNLAKIFGVEACDSNGQVQAYVGDFMIPIERSQEYFEWFKENGNDCYPIYICPINFPEASPFIKTKKVSIDFGIGYGVHPKNSDTINRIDYLRKCMIKAYELNGDMLKYNSIYKSKEEFWNYYPTKLKNRYDILRKTHDPNERFYNVSKKLTI